MKSNLLIVRVSILLVCILPTWLYAQDALIVSPYNKEYISQVFRENSLFGNSLTKIEIEAIPSNIIYRIIFKEIQEDQSRLFTLSRNDSEIVLNLPSHSHPKFVVAEYIAREEICSEFSMSKAATQTLLLTKLAKKYDDIQRNRNLQLNKHYEQVLDHLSSHAFEIVSKKYEELIGTNKLSYSEVSIEGLSKSAPLVAQQILTNSCEINALLKASLDTEDTLLIEETRRAMLVDGDQSKR